MCVSCIGYYSGTNSHLLGSCYSHLSWWVVNGFMGVQREGRERETMGDYGWSMDSDTPQGIDAVEYGRVLEYPKREIKSQTTRTRKPDLFR